MVIGTSLGLINLIKKPKTAGKLLFSGLEWTFNSINVFESASAVLKNKDSNLVDPASSHMLVLKIKPCMSKYK
jgi:hypothetical protein